jgi:hypothetical protein
MDYGFNVSYLVSVQQTLVNVSHNPSLTLMQEPKLANTAFVFYFYDEYVKSRREIFSVQRNYWKA